LEARCVVRIYLAGKAVSFINEALDYSLDLCGLACSLLLDLGFCEVIEGEMLAEICTT
jgi:hypothetical protein